MFFRPLVLLFIVLGKTLDYATKLMTNGADYMLHCLLRPKIALI